MMTTITTATTTIAMVSPESITELAKAEGVAYCAKKAEMHL
jgi:hypothetical protein